MMTDETPTSEAPKFDPVKPTITYDDFDKIDLRVAQIVDATPVENTDKLMELKVDLGFEQRTIVAGVKQHYAPEQLRGKLIVIVANLAPRKLKGIESHGMLLAASDGVNFSLVTALANSGTAVH